jgi:hypothetical protein
MEKRKFTSNLRFTEKVIIDKKEDFLSQFLNDKELVRKIINQSLITTYVKEIINSSQKYTDELLKSKLDDEFLLNLKELCKNKEKEEQELYDRLLKSLKLYIKEEFEKIKDIVSKKLDLKNGET